MGFLFGLRRKDKEGIKCEHLIKYDRTKVQISGLSLGDYKLGEFGIDPKLLQAASHALMLLDATQYDLCITIKGITDNKLRDFYYKKMVDDKIRSQNIIRVIASLSMDPKSKQLQDTLKDLIISNQQIV